MNKGRKQTISTRVLSVTFVAVALAVFKPFGLDAWQWHAYVHLLAIWVIGITVCMLTDLILKYIVRMPRRYDKGVSYIIRRNLWFQCINTPLVSLMICLYRHFVMSDRVPGNQFSLMNFLETLVIIAFCSFAIGLYWRFKFRSKYLAMELEEIRELNEQLKALPLPLPAREGSDYPAGEKSTEIVSTPLPRREGQGESLSGEAVFLRGTTNDSVTLQISDLLYIEAVGNYVKVCHLRDGLVRTDMLRATSKQMEDDLRSYPMIVRCHRAFLVNLRQVEQIVAKSGSMQLLIRYSHDSLPVSRSNMAQVKEVIKGTNKSGEFKV